MKWESLHILGAITPVVAVRLTWTLNTRGATKHLNPETPGPRKQLYYLTWTFSPGFCLLDRLPWTWPSAVRLLFKVLFCAADV